MAYQQPASTLRNCTFITAPANWIYWKFPKLNFMKIVQRLSSCFMYTDRKTDGLRGLERHSVGLPQNRSIHNAWEECICYSLYSQFVTFTENKLPSRQEARYYWASSVTLQMVKLFQSSVIRPAMRAYGVWGLEVYTSTYVSTLFSHSFMLTVYFKETGRHITLVSRHGCPGPIRTNHAGFVMDEVTL
jgi:hypothetical protein